MPQYYAAGIGVFSESAGSRAIGKQPSNTGSLRSAPSRVRVNPDPSVGPFTRGNLNNNNTAPAPGEDPRPNWDGARTYRPDVLYPAVKVRTPRSGRRPLGASEQRQPSSEANLRRGIPRRPADPGDMSHHGRTA